MINSIITCARNDTQSDALQYSWNVHTILSFLVIVGSLAITERKYHAVLGSRHTRELNRFQQQQAFVTLRTFTLPLRESRGVGKSDRGDDREGRLLKEENRSI